MGSIKDQQINVPVEQKCHFLSSISFFIRERRNFTLLGNEKGHSPNKYTDKIIQLLTYEINW